MANIYIRSGPEERFGQLGLFTLKRRKLMGNMTAVCKYSVSENEGNNLICLFMGDKIWLKKCLKSIRNAY